jgi:hypothetical protein
MLTSLTLGITPAILWILRDGTKRKKELRGNSIRDPIDLTFPPFNDALAFNVIDDTVLDLEEDTKSIANKILGTCLHEFSTQVIQVD